MSVKEQVIAYFGGPGPLAELLDCSRQNVSQWRRIPKWRAKEIEKLSHGRFTKDWIMEQQDKEEEGSDRPKIGRPRKAKAASPQLDLEVA